MLGQSNSAGMGILDFCRCTERWVPIGGFFSLIFSIMFISTERINYHKDYYTIEYEVIMNQNSTCTDNGFDNIFTFLLQTTNIEYKETINQSEITRTVGFDPWNITRFADSKQILNYQLCYRQVKYNPPNQTDNDSFFKDEAKYFLTGFHITSNKNNSLVKLQRLEENQRRGGLVGTFDFLRSAQASLIPLPYDVDSKQGTLLAVTKALSDEGEGEIYQTIDLIEEEIRGQRIINGLPLRVFAVFEMLQGFFILLGHVQQYLPTPILKPWIGHPKAIFLVCEVITVLTQWDDVYPFISFAKKEIYSLFTAFDSHVKLASILFVISFFFMNTFVFIVIISFRAYYIYEICRKINKGNQDNEKTGNRSHGDQSCHNNSNRVIIVSPYQNQPEQRPLIRSNMDNNESPDKNQPKNQQLNQVETKVEVQKIQQLKQSDQPLAQQQDQQNQHENPLVQNQQLKKVNKKIKFNQIVDVSHQIPASAGNAVFIPKTKLKKDLPPNDSSIQDP